MARGEANPRRFALLLVGFRSADDIVPFLSLRIRSVPPGKLTCILYKGKGTNPPPLYDHEALTAYMASQLNPSACWDDVKWLRSIYKGTILVKGVCTKEEGE